MSAELYISQFIIFYHMCRFHVIARKNLDLENNYALPVNHTDNMSCNESYKGKPYVLYIARGSLNYSTFQVETSALSQRVSMSHILPATPPEIFYKHKLLFQGRYTTNKLFFFFF